MEYERSQTSWLAAGIGCRCPRCGRGRLLQGFLTVRPSCEECGLDFGFADSGDGPAFFVMSLVGIVVVAMAMWVEFTWEPPLWLHALLWLPFTVLLSALLVRPAKGLMVAAQYANKAEQGRLRQ